jgi:hypothetical protein
MTPIVRMIDTADLRCTLCNAKAGTCNCWGQCTCGWSHRKGKCCGNPKTARCSSKVAFGKYNRRTNRYE